MLCLTEQVGGDDHRVGGLVGDDQDLRRAGDEVDADLAEQPALGLDDVRVARADEEVHRVDRLRPERERRERLDAAEDVDLVGAGEVHRGDGGVRDPPVEGWRAGRNALDAGDLRRDDAHVRGGDHRVAAAGHVRADARHGNVPVAEPDAGKRLHLEVGHRRPLCLRERAHLLLAERDVVEHLGGNALEARGDLVGVEPEALRLPAVEAGRVPPDGGVSVRRDGRDDLVDDLRDGTVVDRALMARMGVFRVCKGLFRGSDYVCIDRGWWSCQIVSTPPAPPLTAGAIDGAVCHAPTMAVTSKDIARKLRISQSTVSRALRGDPRVAPETMARVLEAARQMNYTPNLAARSLITRRTGTVGVVVNDITNPFYPELLEILHNEFALAGYRTVLFNERTDASAGAAHRRPRQRRGGGRGHLRVGDARIAAPGTAAAACRWSS